MKPVLLELPASTSAPQVTSSQSIYEAAGVRQRSAYWQEEKRGRCKFNGGFVEALSTEVPAGQHGDFSTLGGWRGGRGVLVKPDIG